MTATVPAELIRRQSVFVILLPDSSYRVNLSTAICSKTFIAHGMGPPISMAAFPAVETLQPEGFTRQPKVAGSQVKILAANETHVLVTIPHVIVRYHPRCLDHWWRSHIYGRRSYNDQWLEGDLPVWLQHTT